MAVARFGSMSVKANIGYWAMMPSKFWWPRPSTRVGSRLIGLSWRRKLGRGSIGVLLGAILGAESMAQLFSLLSNGVEGEKEFGVPAAKWGKVCMHHGGPWHGNLAVPAVDGFGSVRRGLARGRVINDLSVFGFSEAFPIATLSGGDRDIVPTMRQLVRAARWPGEWILVGAAFLSGLWQSKVRHGVAASMS